MYWTLSVIFLLALTFHGVLALTPSDGYNIGVVLGSVVGALLAVGIAAFVFYMFCIRRWLGIGEPAELGYSRQNDRNLKKQKPSPSKFNFGIQGKSPYTGGVVPRDTGRRQGAANEVYEQSRPTSKYEVSGEPQVALSTAVEQQIRHSPNVSYSSEEMRAGRAGYEVSSTRAYQQRTYQQQTNSGGGSPLSAAYLGTGV